MSGLSVFEPFGLKEAKFPPYNLKPLDFKGNIAPPMPVIESGIEHAWKSKHDDVYSRLDALESNFEILNKIIIQNYNSHDENISKIRKEIFKESESSEESESEILDKIREISTQGLPTVGIGTCWLFSGLLLSSFSEKIAQLSFKLFSLLQYMCSTMAKPAYFI